MKSSSKDSKFFEIPKPKEKKEEEDIKTKKFYMEGKEYEPQKLHAKAKIEVMQCKLKNGIFQLYNRPS